ncbi:MAG TPA: SBBP repeat-containing protein, partial [Planctomycetota bacterium]|nr:SBBP repeat-containing protein [Planctomycetota bacterium]
GGSLLYSTFLGGGGEDDYVRGLALDGTGSATVAGSTDSSDFPTTAGAYDTSYGGGGYYPSDAFVSRLSPSGDGLRYSTFLGTGLDADHAQALAVDGSGSAVVAGQTSSYDFPTTAGAYDTTWAGFLDGFVTRLDMMPAGASPYGASTPGCAGPLPIGVTSIPQVGNASFAVTCGNGPANAFGFFGTSSAGLAMPLVFGGLAVWIDPFAPLFFEIVVPSDAVGAALVPIPVPANPALAGAQLFFQFAWFDGCAPGGFSASNALAVTVQP